MFSIVLLWEIFKIILCVPSYLQDSEHEHEQWHATEGQKSQSPNPYLDRKSTVTGRQTFLGGASQATEPASSGAKK